MMVLKRLPYVALVFGGAALAGWQFAALLALIVVLGASYERFLAWRDVQRLRDELADMEWADRLRRIWHGQPEVESAPAPEPAPAVMAFASRGALPPSSPHIGRPPAIDMAAYRDDQPGPAQLAATTATPKPKLGKRARLGLRLLRIGAPMWTLRVSAIGARTARHAAPDEVELEPGEVYRGGRHAADPEDRPAPPVVEPSGEMRTLSADWRIPTGEWDAAYRQFFADATAAAGVW